MAKPIRLQPQKTADGSWRVNVPPTLSTKKKRERLFYPTKEKALAAVAKLKEDREEFGRQAGAVAPSLADAATAAEALLAPLGIGLLEAVRRFVEAETRLRASVPIKDACDAFRATGGGWSDSQARAYRLRCEKLEEAFSGRMISTITGEELAAHLADTTTGPGAFNQGVRLLRAVWRWCAKPPRLWCPTAPIEQLEAKATVSDGVGILTGRYLAKLYSVTPECIGRWAKLGRIPAIRFQGTVRYNLAAVRAKIESKP